MFRLIQHGKSLNNDSLSINTVLSPGTYYIDVDSDFDGTPEYNLSLIHISPSSDNLCNCVSSAKRLICISFQPPLL